MRNSFLERGATGKLKFPESSLINDHLGKHQKGRTSAHEKEKYYLENVQELMRNRIRLLVN